MEFPEFPEPQQQLLLDVQQILAAPRWVITIQPNNEREIPQTLGHRCIRMCVWAKERISPCVAVLTKCDVLWSVRACVYVCLDACTHNIFF